MDSYAILASRRENQDQAAQALERSVKTARRFVDRESLAVVRSACEAYLERLEAYLDAKDLAETR